MASYGYGTANLSKNPSKRKKQLDKRRTAAKKAATKSKPKGPGVSVAGAIRKVSARKRTNARKKY